MAMRSVMLLIADWGLASSRHIILNIFHEKPAPYPVKIEGILNLNDNFVYEQISINGDYGIIINDENNYGFSRIRTLFKAQELAPSVQLIQIAQA